MIKYINRFFGGLRYTLTGSNSKIKTLEERLHELEGKVNRDELTGLYNKRGFDDLVKRELRKGLRIGDINVQLIYFDIDDFKQINDSFGHDSGDEVIKTFAGFLSKSGRKEDIVARLSGGADEFVYFPNYETKINSNGLLLRLRSEIDRYNIVGRHIKRGFELDFSYGIATKNLPAFNPEANKDKYLLYEDFLNETIGKLLSYAEMGMYDMKRRKRLSLVAAKGGSPNNLKRLDEKSAKA